MSTALLWQSSTSSAFQSCKQTAAFLRRRRKLWSLACAFADLDDSEDSTEMAEGELTATVSAIEGSENEGQSYEEELDIMLDEDVIELDNQQINISESFATATAHV